MIQASDLRKWKCEIIQRDPNCQKPKIIAKKPSKTCATVFLETHLQGAMKKGGGRGELW